jgi:hypothetical protein
MGIHTVARTMKVAHAEAKQAYSQVSEEATKELCKDMDSIRSCFMLETATLTVRHWCMRQLRAEQRCVKTTSLPNALHVIVET